MPGFEWTHPRQVAPAELSRKRRQVEAPGADRMGREEEGYPRHGRGHRGHGQGYQRQDGKAGKQHTAGLVLETIPCQNRAGQIFYLSVEAATPRVRQGSQCRGYSPVELVVGYQLGTLVPGLRARFSVSASVDWGRIWRRALERILGRASLDFHFLWHIDHDGY